MRPAYPKSYASSKAVSDGAVIWNCTRAVNARVARFSYGTTVHPLYDPNNPEHAGRYMYERSDGTKRVRNAWRDLVLKVHYVSLFVF